MHEVKGLGFVIWAASVKETGDESTCPASIADNVVSGGGTWHREGSLSVNVAVVLTHLKSIASHLMSVPWRMLDSQAVGHLGYLAYC